MMRNVYSLLRISIIFLYYNYLSSHKSSSEQLNKTSIYHEELVFLCKYSI